MRIAVVGSGVSGLVAAHYLQRRHEVVLFEAERRPGGHTNTVTVLEGERPISIDTGFIVFNTRTYPRFVRLLGELGVAWAESDMSFSASSERRGFEYNAQDLGTLYAQPRHLVSPRFHRMVLDILRFFREARALLDSTDETPLLPWLRARGYSEGFLEDHLLPLVRAVWSANRDVAERFPARFLVRFFDNHGFLKVRDRVPWLTIPGGARTYVRAILAGFRGQVRLGAPVRGLRREPDAVVVRSEGAEPERFDHVVLACHADQARALLEDPTALEDELLGAFPYQRNEAMLHTDASLMPRRRKVWASWNAHLDDDGAEGACLTYWMNRLQPLGASRDYFVTLNRGHRIRPDRVVSRIEYAHPVFTLAGVAAQARHGELIDRQRTSYCGAYWRNGFHEDGVVSALAVCARLGVEP